MNANHGLGLAKNYQNNVFMISVALEMVRNLSLTYDNVQFTS